MSNSKTRSGLSTTVNSSNFLQNLEASTRDEPSHRPNSIQLNRREGSASKEASTITKMVDKYGPYKSPGDKSVKRSDSFGRGAEVNSAWNDQNISRPSISRKEESSFTKLHQMDSDRDILHSTKFQAAPIRNHGAILEKDKFFDETKNFRSSSCYVKSFCNGNTAQELPDTPVRSRNILRIPPKVQRITEDCSPNDSSIPTASQMLDTDGSDNDFITVKSNNTHKRSNKLTPHQHSIPHSQNIYNALDNDDENDDEVSPCCDVWRY